MGCNSYIGATKRDMADARTRLHEWRWFLVSFPFYFHDLFFNEPRTPQNQKVKAQGALPITPSVMKLKLASPPPCRYHSRQTIGQLYRRREKERRREGRRIPKCLVKVTMLKSSPPSTSTPPLPPPRSRTTNWLSSVGHSLAVEIYLLNFEWSLRGVLWLGKSLVASVPPPPQWSGAFYYHLARPKLFTIYRQYFVKPIEH